MRPNYNPADVQAVARAVLSIEPVLTECRSDYRTCQFCFREQGVSYVNGAEMDGGRFPHAPDCAMLVAQDLLTGEKS